MRGFRVVLLGGTRTLGDGLGEFEDGMNDLRGAKVGY